MNRNDDQLRQFPQEIRGMVTEEEQDVTELHRVYATVLSTRNELNARLDEINKQLVNVNIYMARAEAIEKERNLPARIDALGARQDASIARIQALEEARKTDQAQGAGKRSVGDTAVKIASYVSLLLGIVLAIKAIWGK